MKTSILAFLLVIAAASAASSDEPPRGEWHHADIRSIEVLPGGMCVRLWLEQRTYNLLPSGESRFMGTYFNMIRAAPVGVPSLHPDCRYPAPANNPVANQFRGWSIVGSRAERQGWRVRAEPGAPGGDLRVLETKEFETTLYREGELLVDSIGARDDPEKTLVFRASAVVPAAARAALEETVRRLTGGACLEVMSKLVPSNASVQEICALRQRMSQIAGRLLSISVDDATVFDRVPNGFPRAPSNGFRRQQGVFFSFDGHYENQQIPGNAVVFEEGGIWNVVLLWF